jgi:hypothetical protein
MVCTPKCNEGVTSRIQSFVGKVGNVSRKARPGLAAVELDVRGTGVTVDGGWNSIQIVFSGQLWCLWCSCTRQIQN